MSINNHSLDFVVRIAAAVIMILIIIELGWAYVEYVKHHENIVKTEQATNREVDDYQKLQRLVPKPQNFLIQNLKQITAPAASQH